MNNTNTVLLSQNMHRCRLCLKVSSNVINIFREDFPKMIKLLSSIQVKQTDDLPKVACITCAKKVKLAMIMRKQIIVSHRTLLEETLAKKKSAALSVTCTKVNPENPIQTSLDEDINKIKVQTELETLHSEVILVKVENDLDVQQEEQIVLVPSLEPSPNINTVSNMLNEQNIQNFKESLERNEISIVKANKSKNQDRLAIATMNVQGNSRRIPKRKPTTRKYNPLEQIPCEICQKPIQKTNMKKHVETHDKKMVTCHICGKVTKNTSLRTHIFYFHKCKENEYICDQCGKHFRYRNKFNLHMMKQHGGTKKFECTICGRKFFERKYLTKHIDSHHNKIRPFICDYCGKNFSTKNALKVHLRQHTETAPYSCETCGQRFRQKVSLRTHRKHAHKIIEEETIFCQECGKGFASTVALGSHFKIHERKKCVHCSEFFVTDDYLEKHIKEKHGTLILKDDDNFEAVKNLENDNESLTSE